MTDTLYQKPRAGATPARERTGSPITAGPLTCARVDDPVMLDGRVVIPREGDFDA